MLISLLISIHISHIKIYNNEFTWMLFLHCRWFQWCHRSFIYYIGRSISEKIQHKVNYLYIYIYRELYVQGCGTQGAPLELGIHRVKKIFKKISYLFRLPWKMFVPSPLYMLCRYWLNHKSYYLHSLLKFCLCKQNIYYMMNINWIFFMYFEEKTNKTTFFHPFWRQKTYLLWIVIFGIYSLKKLTSFCLLLFLYT